MKKKLLISVITASVCFAAAGCGATQDDAAITTASDSTKIESTTASEIPTTTATTEQPTTIPTEPPTTTTTEAPTTTTAESKDAYIEKCKNYDFKEIARNPEQHRGEYAVFTGEVIQVLEESGSYTMRVNITKGEYVWTDTIMVYYEGDGNNNRILEKDIITMYGQLAGIYTYTNVMGGENSVPLLLAEYIDIN